MYSEACFICLFLLQNILHRLSLVFVNLYYYKKENRQYMSLVLIVYHQLRFREISIYRWNRKHIMLDGPLCFLLRNRVLFSGLALSRPFVSFFYINEMRCSSPVLFDKKKCFITTCTSRTKGLSA